MSCFNGDDRSIDSLHNYTQESYKNDNSNIQLLATNIHKNIHLQSVFCVPFSMEMFETQK